MNTLQAFFESLAEPARLALIGAALVGSAVVLRKLFLRSEHTLDSAVKHAAGDASK